MGQEAFDLHPLHGGLALLGFQPQHHVGELPIELALILRKRLLFLSQPHNQP